MARQYGGHWSPLRKVYGRNRDLVDRYGISVSQMTTDMFHKSYALPGSFLVHDLSQSTDHKQIAIYGLHLKGQTLISS
jgi:hypothetical protein